MAQSTLQEQLDELRALLDQARELFGANPLAPPADIAPIAGAVQTWVS